MGGIEKEKHVKDCCSHPQEKTFGSLKSNFGTKEHREIILDKPGMPTKSNNQEEGKEKDDKEIFCHPQEDIPIEEVKDSHIVNKTTNADSKNEVIDGTTTALKPSSNKSEWISSRPQKISPRLQ